MSKVYYRIFLIIAMLLICACSGGSDVVKVKTVSDASLDSIGEQHLAKIAEIKRTKDTEENRLKNVIKTTTNYTVGQYLSIHPDANNPSSLDFDLGGYDVIDITVYEEEDLTRQGVRISADGYISFPLIGRLQVEGLTTSEVESLISQKLAEGQYIYNAHVSVLVREYNSKQYLVLGSVKSPGSFPFKGKVRVLDAISRAEGIDFEQGGKQAMIIRRENADTAQEEKVVIRIELNELLKGGDPVSNLLLKDKDLLYIPKAESFYIIGQIQSPGSYPYMEKEITLVEAISKAGGFTPLAAGNRTRIIRVEDGVEKVIEVKVEEITKSGKKGQDVIILPGDVIVVPESYF